MNPAQWPKFGHLGGWLAEQSERQIALLSVPTIFLQRWWRQRALPRDHQRLYPILVTKSRRAFSVSHAVQKLLVLRRQEPEMVMAYEKLDGTNLGVCSDGTVFGRRLQVNGDSYQRVPLQPGVTIPSPIQVAVIERQLLDKIMNKKTGKPMAPRLVLYGELMCNAKYDYEERSLARQFICFGAVLDPSSDTGRSHDVDALTELARDLNDQGFLAMVTSSSNGEKETGKINLLLNDKLSAMVHAEGIQCAPLIDQGPLREMCFRMKDTMMNNSNMEGVVLMGKEILLKWKPGWEDESKSCDMLQSVLESNSTITLTMAGVDVEFVLLLATIAKNKKQPPRSVLKQRKKQNGINGIQEKDNKRQPFDQETIEIALMSAMTKYDTLDAYFERSELHVILGYLQQELVDDLGADTKKEIKCIEKTVGKKIGAAFGKWKHANQTRKTKK